MESEKTTERYLSREVKARGAPAGIFFVELKSEGMTSTDQQKKRQAELRALGCTVYADIDTKEKVREILDHEIQSA